MAKKTPMTKAASARIQSATANKMEGKLQKEALLQKHKVLHLKTHKNEENKMDTSDMTQEELDTYSDMNNPNNDADLDDWADMHNPNNDSYIDNDN